MLENCLPMLGIRNFIIGFCLSLFSVMLCGQLHSSASIQTKSFTQQAVKLNLFKEIVSNGKVALLPQSSLVKKQSLEIAQSFQSSPNAEVVDGIEDDEILSINFDDQIPIEIDNNSNFEVSEATLNDTNTPQVAILPEDSIIPEENHQALETPWITAKTKKNVKNKNFEQLLDTPNPSLFTENIQQLTKNDEAVSYKVAERIKQSIIFPIPDEILNDENLTPTFIKKKKPQQPKVQPKPKPKEEVVSTRSEPEVKKHDTTFKKVSHTASSEKKQDVSDTTKTDTSGILDSISSWFNTPKDEISPTAPQTSSAPKKKKAAPTYSTNNVVTNSQPIAKRSTSELADFYSSLQETRQEYSHRKIIPSELKLSFQPQRAEISGSTLTWLKAFSEAAINDDTYLQVRLDATASTDLQRKRLNLLYTIFMNNGVDFKKIDTVFSAMEPNTFIIRTIRIK